MYFYLSLQYSAIQKTVLRHDRLWSIAGISNMLARINEIDLPDIAKKHGGTAIVAGGGKFTARFMDEGMAKLARSECVMLLATTLPMLEFQVSDEIYSGNSFNTLATDNSSPNRVIQELSEQKRAFRGYAVSFNPHLKLCEECGEYPAQEKNRRKDSVKDVCRVCNAAFQESRQIYNDKMADTTLQKVYHGYLREIPEAVDKEPPADFNDLFPNSQDERKRMAVWFSDLNNMNDKVPVWLKQDDENNVLRTFDEFRSTVVNIVVAALVKTFDKPSGKYLPFRLVVAGGDDLCLVMAEKDILDFTRNISAALNESRDHLGADHPLSDAWLRKHGIKDDPKPFGFGGSFVVTSIHTPFSLIHQVGEELMSAAKKTTGRQGNSVNWRVMAEETSATDNLLSFERPLFIEAADKDKIVEGARALGCLSFNDYLTLRDRYLGKTKEGKKISGSHLQQIVAIMQIEKNPHELDRRLKLLDAAEADKSFSPLLRDERFHDADGVLMAERIATLFELLTIAGGVE